MSEASSSPSRPRAGWRGWRGRPRPGRARGSIGLAVVVLAVLALNGCGSSKPAAAPTTTTSTATTKAAAAAETVTLDSRQVVVRGRQAVTGTAPIDVDDNYFTPNLLTAAPGSTVVLHLASKAAGLHNLTVLGQSVDHDVAAGTTFDVSVTVPASGPLLFYCKYHREESGMVGAINPT